MLYRLKYGSHSDGERFYRERDLVESRLDLMELFPGRFEEVSRRRPELTGTLPSPAEGLGLEDLTVSELRSLAQEEKVDVSGIEGRGDLLEVLRAVLGQ